VRLLKSPESKGNNRIQKFDNHGNFLAQFGTSGSGSGQFNHPEGIAVDGMGDIFVADTYNHRIQKFDGAGNYLSQFGNGQLNYPGGIRVDGNGALVVTDFGNSRIAVFAQVPTTTATFVPNAGHTSGSLALAVPNTVAPVSDTVYSLDGADFQSYTAPIAVSDNGLHIVLFQSTDNLGNQEDMQSFYFAAAPVALSLSPDHVVTGSGPTVLTVSGAGFDAACKILLDGHALATTFVDINNLQANLTNFTTAATHKVTVADSHGHVSNPLVLRVGKAHLAVSATLSQDANNNVIATVTLKNTGPIDANGVTLNTATMTNITLPGGSPVFSTTSLPLGIGTLSAGSSVTTTLTFPLSVAANGPKVRLALSGVYAGGNFSFSATKTLSGSPNLAISASLSRDASNNLLATLTFTNTGLSGAASVTLTSAIAVNSLVFGSFGSVPTTAPTVTPLPVGIGTVPAGGSATATITFAADSVLSSGNKVILELVGTFTGGNFTYQSEPMILP
jgi:hypothetical protein